MNQRKVRTTALIGVLLLLLSLFLVAPAVTVVKPDAWDIIGAAWLETALGVTGALTGAVLVILVSGRLKPRRPLLLSILLSIIPLMAFGIGGGQGSKKGTKGAALTHEAPDELVVEYITGEILANGHVHRGEQTNGLGWLFLLPPKEYTRCLSDLRGACKGKQRPEEVQQQIKELLAAWGARATEFLNDDVR